MDNKFDLKKFLAENRQDSVNEAADLYNRNGIQITRFSGGDKGLMVQINYGGKYIHISAEEYPFLVRAMQSIQDDIKDMSRQYPRSKNMDERQQPINEEDTDYSDMATPDDGLLYVDKRDDETGRRTESGQIIHINGIPHKVFDSNDLMDLAQSQRLSGDEGNHLLIKVEEE